MYGDSHALSFDSSPISSPNPKPEQHLAASPKNPELWLLFMESDTNSNYSEYRQQFSSSDSGQISSGLLKYRSAPSFLLESFTNNGIHEKGTGRLSSRFCFDDENSRMNDFCTNNRSSGIGVQLPPQYPSQNVGQLGALGVDGGGFGAVVVSSMGMENQVQAKMGSSLLRQNSTPAGFFSNLTPQHGHGSIRSGTGGYKIFDYGDNNGDFSPCSSRLKNRNIFFSGTLSRISEVENGVPDDAKAGINGSDHDSLFGFPFGSWHDSSNFPENFSTSIKRELDDDPHKLFGNTLNREPDNRSNTLSRHLSLPKTSSEMEKLLQLQDMVPCKIRAKRGCATHPRSIAERLRRTRISERMRKLQELVPNMDKQTNTADMLDLAVEYIKNLQKQYKALCENRADCKCSASQKMVLKQRS